MEDPEITINVGALSANARTGFDFESGSIAGSTDLRPTFIDVRRVRGYNGSAATLTIEGNGRTTYVSPQQPFDFAPGGAIRIRTLIITPDAGVNANEIRLFASGPART